MKCSRCGSEMKIKTVKVDTDTFGNPTYRKYAYCPNCKTKRTLDQTTPNRSHSRKLNEKRRKKRRQRRLIILTVLLLAIALIAGACIFFFAGNKKKNEQQADLVATDAHKNKISTKDFARLELGMTTKDVFTLIGNEGNKLMQSSTEDSTSERYQWASSDKGAVILSFRDDKLINISQSGMEESDSLTLTAEMVNLLKPEMSYKDVKSALGGDGALMSETISDGITTDLYAWTDAESKANITVVFVDGKMKSATAGGFAE